MATDLNIDEDSEDLWETSNDVFDNFNEENVLKHLTEKAELRTDRHYGFDNNSGDTWIYPTNYPVRKYQHDVVYNALFKNTLVSIKNHISFCFLYKNNRIFVYVCVCVCSLFICLNNQKILDQIERIFRQCKQGSEIDRFKLVFLPKGMTCYRL